MVKFLLQYQAKSAKNQVEMLKTNPDLDLFKAVRENDLRTFKLLVKGGYDKNEPNENGLSPLHMACF